MSWKILNILLGVYGGYLFLTQGVVVIKEVDSIPYRPVRPVYTVPASKPVHITLLFHTGKNTDHTGQFQAIPADIEKSFYFFIYFLKICNF